ncbi:flagellar protein FliS [Rhodopirellula maiorica SM1]|uniref:Flagellar protein FliS n=1 Tax=Rhodopirellula maiorica SM1 TaxID=1265738 RepID=M5S1V9_9BACT|nr:flagellar export chaperone FliS [Rhodopirellula maiorica]EMI21632.1 flagellar protein FliS [Rhodopirellula maiorica SM1]
MSYSPSHAASNYQPSGHKQSRRSTDGYLESSIQHATPARLRLMILERAVEVARMLANTWRTQPDKKGSNEYSLKLLDLITELLSGITGNEEVCVQVADLYVFLSKHLLLSEQTSDADAVDELRQILEIEADTWRMVCANETLAKTPGLSSAGTPAAPVSTDAPISGGLNLQG